VASALGVPEPEADPQVFLTPGAFGALPLTASPLLRSGFASPAVAVQNPAVFATPAVRTIPAPIAAPLPFLLGKSAPCVNDANIPVPCADVDVDFVRAFPAPIAAPFARTVFAAPAPVARTVIAAPAPFARTVVAAPAVRTITPLAPHRVLTPQDCVTVGGCQLRAALEGRVLFKRDAEATSEADAEAEADPQFLAAGLPLAYNNLGYNNLGYNNLGYNNLGYNNLAYNNLGYNNLGYNNLAYNNLGYNNLGYNNLYNNNLYARHYNGLYNPYNYGVAAPAIAPHALRTVAAAPAAVAVNAALPAIAAPALRTVAVNAALPAHIVAAPYARSPVVVEKAVPVTYTHLGAHPINPTTVVERRQQLVL